MTSCPIALTHSVFAADGELQEADNPQFVYGPSGAPMSCAYEYQGDIYDFVPIQQHPFAFAYLHSTSREECCTICTIINNYCLTGDTRGWSECKTQCNDIFPAPAVPSSGGILDDLGFGGIIDAAQAIWNSFGRRRHFTSEAWVYDQCRSARPEAREACLRAYEPFSGFATMGSNAKRRLEEALHKIPCSDLTAWQLIGVTLDMVALAGLPTDSLTCSITIAEVIDTASREASDTEKIRAVQTAIMNCIDDIFRDNPAMQSITAAYNWGGIVDTCLRDQDW